jgi:beta-lactamase regulating signal transducer with metallopeptidase domain
MPDACVEWLLRSSAVMAAVWVLSFMPRVSAALRHGWIVLGMAGALLMPWFMTALPSWSPGLLTRYTPVPSAPQTRTVVNVVLAEPSSFMNAVSAPAPGVIVPAIPPPAAVVTEVSKPLTLLFAWTGGTVLLVLRLLLAAFCWQRSVRSAERVHGPWRMDVRRTSRTAAPVSGGLWRSVVLLPEDSIQWTPGRMNAVLAHEAEHLRRRDAWWLLLGHILCAVQWFNPLAWLIHRRATSLREEACDAAALRGGVPAAEYADALLALASPHGLSAMASPMARRSGLERRIRSVLQGAIGARPASRPAMFLGFAGLCALTLCASSLRSQEKLVPAPLQNGNPSPAQRDAPETVLPPDLTVILKEPEPAEVVLDPGGREFAPDGPEAAAEAAQTLDLAVRIKKLLETERARPAFAFPEGPPPVKVFLTRTSAEVVSTEERARLIKAHPSAALLSIQPGDFESKDYKGMAALVTKREPWLSRSMVLAHHILVKSGPGAGVRLPPVFYSAHPLLAASAKNPASVVLYTGNRTRDASAWRTLAFAAVENLQLDARARGDGPPSQIVNASGSGLTGDTLRSGDGDGILATKIDGSPAVVRWTADMIEYSMPGGDNIEEMKLNGDPAIQFLMGEKPVLISGGDRAECSFKRGSFRVEGLFELRTEGYIFKGSAPSSILSSNEHGGFTVNGGSIINQNR